MKFSYNWLQQYCSQKLPPPQKLAELLTLHAFEVEKVEELKNKDWVFELDILPNRMSDAASHVGVAREIAAILNLKSQISNLKIKAQKSKAAPELRVPKYELREDPARPIAGYLAVKSEDKNFCPRYSARVIFGVKVGPSPQWLRERLASVGVGSINNIVDATNYVMLELGQPLHAFDFDKIKSENPRLRQGYGGQAKSPSTVSNQSSKKFKEIIVRKAKQRETIETLDGRKVMLGPSILVIADSARLLAIAGLKGGKGAEITKTTNAIVLESANFDRVAIRRASKSLGIATDASLRFESGLDQNLTIQALDRVAALICEIAGGVCAKGILDAQSSKQRTRIVPLSLSHVASYCGVEIPRAVITKILVSLGCAIKSHAARNTLLVTIPSWRLDLEREEDLIEEIARLIGYDAIKPVMPVVALARAKRPERELLADRVRMALKEVGLFETHTYALVSEALLKKCGISPDQAHALANPPSAEFEYLVPSLLPRLLEQAKLNVKHAGSASLFEIATVFSKEKNAVIERLKLTTVFAKKDAAGQDEFFTLKGIVAETIKSMGVADIVFDAWHATLDEAPQALWHPTRVAEIKAGGVEVGLFGELNPKVIEEIEIPARVFAADINFDLLSNLASEEHEYREPSKYPEVVRDIALLVPQEILVDTVASEIATSGGLLLRDLDLFDYYEGEGIPEDKKNLAFHLYFQSPERTLKTKEIDEVMANVIQRAKELGWEIRK